MGEIFKLRLLLDAVRPSQPPARARWRLRSSLSPEMIVAKIFAINKVAAEKTTERCSRNPEHNCPILTDTQFTTVEKH